MLSYQEDLLVFIVALFCFSFGISSITMRRYGVGQGPWRVLGIASVIYGSTVWLTLDTVRLHIPWDYAFIGMWSRFVAVGMLNYFGWTSLFPPRTRHRRFALLFCLGSCGLVAVGYALRLEGYWLACAILTGYVLTCLAFIKIARQTPDHRKDLLVLAATMLISGVMLSATQYFRLANPSPESVLRVKSMLAPSFFMALCLISSCVALSLIQKRCLIQMYGPQVLRGTMRGHWLMFMALIVLIIASLFYEINLRKAEKNLHGNMLAQVNILTQTIQPEEVKRLTGTLADLAAPGYQALKAQFLAQKKNIPMYRYIYLTQIKNGQAVFIMDSDLEGNEGYTPPGTVYTEITPSFFSALHGRQPFIEGPYEDRWGIWVTACDPIFDPATGQVLAFMCIDVNAKTWHNIIQKEGLLPLLVSVVFLMVLGTVYYQLITLAIERTRFELAERHLADSHQNLEKANEQLKVMINRANALAFEAEAATIAKSQFLANMTHELRTPLNGVLGMAELLLDEELAEQSRIFAETILQSGRHLLRIINDILDYTKIETGMLDVECRTFNLETLLDSLVRGMKGAADEKGLTLDYELAPGVDMKFCDDEAHLRHILWHLLDNAIKFTQSGSVLIRAKSQGQVDFTEMMEFEIRDTGIGIPAALIDSLFAPFKQLDNSDTRRYGGVGLGLSVCKKLAEFMGGTLVLESQLGSGTVARLVIPLARSSALQTLGSGPSIQR